MTLTPEELEAIRERTSKATEGPWETEESHGFNIWRREGETVTKVYWKPGIQSRSDMEFIANARTDIPALLSHIDALAAGLERRCSPWVPVEEGLPATDDEVFVRFDYPTSEARKLVGTIGRFECGYWHLHNEQIQLPITHWMPLPPPPDKEEVERLTTQLQEARRELITTRRQVCSLKAGRVKMDVVRRGARRETMEACCRAVCERCFVGHPVKKCGEVYMHGKDGLHITYCGAQAIRRVFESKGEEG